MTQTTPVRPAVRPESLAQNAGAGKQPRPDPRQEMFDRLPKGRLIQAFLTYVTGKPHPGQQPLFRHTPHSIVAMFHLMLTLAVVLTGAAVVRFSQVGPAEQFLLACGIVCGQMIIAGRLRACHHTLLHHSSHQDFGAKWSRFVGEFAALVSGTMSLDEYRPKHMRHHADPGVDGDPELEVLMSLGFLPGQTPDWYRRHLVRVLFCPRRFGGYLHRRWLSNYGPGLPAWRKAVAAALHLGPAAMAIGLAWLRADPLPVVVYGLAWLLPWTVGMYWSMLFYVIGLHRWMYQPAPGMTAREILAAKTGARFFGDPLPPRGLPFLLACRLWGIWWVRLIGLHWLVSRLFCVSGDNSSHDAHHLIPGRGFDWCNACYDRARLVGAGCSGLWESWGLFAAAADSFSVLASLPAEAGQAASAPPHAWIEADM